MRPRKPITNDHGGAIARLLRLDEAIILGLKDFPVGGDGIRDQGLGLAGLEDTEEGRVGTLGTPATVQIRDPGRREKIDHLAQKPMMVLLRGHESQPLPSLLSSCLGTDKKNRGCCDAPPGSDLVRIMMRVTHLWRGQMSQRRDIVRIDKERIDEAQCEVGDIQDSDQDERLRGEDASRREGERGCGSGSHGGIPAIQPGARARRVIGGKTSSRRAR